MQNETPFLILSLQTASGTKIVSYLVPFAIELEVLFRNCRIGRVKRFKSKKT